MISENFLKLRFLLSNKLNAVTKIDWRGKNMILDAKNSCIWKCRTFNEVFMNVFGVNKPFEVKLEHDRQVANKKIFHVIIFMTLMFFPDKVPDESLDDIFVFAHFI